MSSDEGESVSINMDAPDPKHSRNPQFQAKKSLPAGKSRLPKGKSGASSSSSGRRGSDDGGSGTQGVKQRFQYNSTNTIVSLDATLDRQNAGDAVTGVAMAILVLIECPEKETDEFRGMFGEGDNGAIDAAWDSEEVRKPTLAKVEELLRSLYDAAQLDAETLIVALVYIERVLSMTRSSLGPTTWRPITTISMILAAKVWNDLAVWNVDFGAAVPECDVSVLNRLEVRMLEALRYAVVVTAQQYARYFFEVRALPSRETVLKRFKAPKLPKKEIAE